jgi:hypothetical protein
MTDHELYEVLCTLAATGQLAAPERANFDEHCLDCSACRDQLQDLIFIGAQLRLDAAIHATPASMPTGSLERFVARVVREGIAPRSAPARPSSLYALASAAAVFVLIAALVFMPHGRKAVEMFATTAAPIPTRQSLSASIPKGTPIAQPAKAVHAHYVRYGPVSHTNAGANDASAAAERFPQTIKTRYPFFAPQSATTSSLTGYPALSPSQISHLDLFLNLKSRNTAGTAKPDHPVDIASIGNVFDFAANIRQLHFELPTAQ